MTYKLEKIESKSKQNLPKHTTEHAMYCYINRTNTSLICYQVEKEDKIKSFKEKMHIQI